MRFRSLFHTLERVVVISSMSLKIARDSVVLGAAVVVDTANSWLRVHVGTPARSPCSAKLHRDKNELAAVVLHCYSVVVVVVDDGSDGTGSVVAAAVAMVPVAGHIHTRCDGCCW